MTISDAVLALPAVELTRKLDAGELTAVELTEAYLDRIARIADPLNCFITVTPDQARADAARADADRVAGRRGPLLGIPYGLKDLLDTAGIATTWGTRPLLDRIPEADAEVVTRLRAAGGVLIGKLAMSELANALGNDWPEAQHRGACRTPWDRTRWAGGSSSGSGAATAAGLCGFAIGTETWGSIDCPAAFCGVVGVRPTYDVVSRRGAMTVCWTLDKIGVLCRDARDARAVLGVIADARPPELAGVTPDRSLRIGYLELGPSPDPAYPLAWDAAQEVLRAAGASYQPVTLHDLPSLPATATILLSEIQVAFEEFVRSGKVHEIYDRVPWADKRAAYDRFGLRAEDYIKATRVRAQVQRAYHALFQQFDVIVAPGRTELPPPVDAKLASADVPSSHARLQCDGNLIGLPAITLPIGFTDAGLPLSMHAVAAPYEDHKVIALGEAYQARTDFHRRRPPEAS